SVRMPAGPAAPAAETISLGWGPRPRDMGTAIGRTTSRANASMRSASDVSAAISVDTNERGLALRDATADPRSTVTATASAQLVQQRHQDACAARTDGVPHRDGAPIDVDDVGVHLEHARAGDGD